MKISLEKIHAFPWDAALFALLIGSFFYFCCFCGKKGIDAVSCVIE